MNLLLSLAGFIPVLRPSYFYLFAQPSGYAPQHTFHSLGCQSGNRQAGNLLRCKSMQIIEPEQGAVAFADRFGRRAQHSVQFRKQHRPPHLRSLRSAGRELRNRIFAERSCYYFATSLSASTCGESNRWLPKPKRCAAGPGRNPLHAARTPAGCGVPARTISGTPPARYRPPLPAMRRTSKAGRRAMPPARPGARNGAETPPIPPHRRSEHRPWPDRSQRCWTCPWRGTPVYRTGTTIVIYSSIKTTPKVTTAFSGAMAPHGSEFPPPSADYPPGPVILRALSHLRE